MAVVFEQEAQGKRYQIRTAGRTVRLYTNGVFHSQYNPYRPFRGHVWDLLALPVLNFRVSRPPKVLLLGLGGGAAALQILRLRPDAQVTAVELDQIHIELAKRYFRLGESNVRFVHQDAVEFVASTRERYDLIVDDLFADTDCDPRFPKRSVAMTEPWLTQLSRRMASSAQMVCNIEGVAEVATLTKLLQRAKLPLRSLFELKVDGYSNSVVCLANKPIRRSDFHRNLREVGHSSRVSFDAFYRIIDRSRALGS